MKKKITEYLIVYECECLMKDKKILEKSCKGNYYCELDYFSRKNVNLIKEAIKEEIMKVNSNVEKVDGVIILNKLELNKEKLNERKERNNRELGKSSEGTKERKEQTKNN